ncbi:hypothetical protein HDU83_005305 [Entophlyctis luteolus]|nr:hypothetical protein HDU82_003809 [Entophlyctis luteolus]KAJ3344176.1 hypothetical protein HDU83_005305 [Entophlyctis luteolus]
MHLTVLAIAAAIAGTVAPSPLPATGNTGAGQENNVSPEVVAAAVQAGIQAVNQENQTQGNCAATCASGAAPTVTMEVSIFGNPNQATCLDANTMQMTVTMNMKVQNCNIPNSNCVNDGPPQDACGLPAVTTTMSFLNGSPANVLSSTTGSFAANTFTVQPVNGTSSYSSTMTVSTPGCVQANPQTTVAGMNFETAATPSVVNAFGININTATCTICLAFA